MVLSSSPRQSSISAVAQKPPRYRRNVSPRSLLRIVTFFASSSLAYSPKVNHRAIAGLWKLTQTKIRPAPKTITYPMKEFTVFPQDNERRKRQQQLKTVTPAEKEEQEILLMLKEDGSFQQYAHDDMSHDEVHIPHTLKYYASDEAVFERFMGRIKGKWDLVDGKLILATDRPISEAEDTLLIGEVVATSEESLLDNPSLLNHTQTSETSVAGQAPVSAFDTHLSIPQGEVNVGKFIYPRNHPAFFEQPMWRPIAKGTFALKQVLGSLNARMAEEKDELSEKFRSQDFHGKRFLLTSHPLGNRRPKGNVRWSIKYSKFVEDPPSREAKKRLEEEENEPLNIRVMEVQFFSNNTFATCGGFGEAIILRGKYHIVGQDRDQLWMQVWRFGFGRSVSGSVFSEGKALTKEDEKIYWGKISHDGEVDGKDGNFKLSSGTIEAKESHEEKAAKRLYVKGSVIYGYGLEPQPVGRFIMTETTDWGDDDDDDDDDYGGGGGGGGGADDNVDNEGETRAFSVGDRPHADDSMGLNDSFQ